MEAYDDVPSQMHGVVSANESDTRNVSDSLNGRSTHSMANVRLSDTSNDPNSVTLNNVEAFIEPFPVGDPPVTNEEPVESNQTFTVTEDEEAVSDEQPVLDEIMQLRHSSRSVGSFEEGDESTITLRSRSDSSGTFSSSDGSAQVDWEELEKEEDQAPRDEGSDEVGVSRPTTCENPNANLP